MFTKIGLGGLPQSSCIISLLVFALRAGRVRMARSGRGQDVLAIGSPIRGLIRNLFLSVNSVLQQFETSLRRCAMLEL
ncbi:unnamed protein product [Protopolystoma xenopodis]|uniref:Uncharacterized protein n=1 Tax=Protopolystoma xenopodis TaxID=117903 RepID=A0A448XPC9_9PLAT|nr:unnamed protein product [Protopolystoma xenopodis]